MMEKAESEFEERAEAGGRQVRFVKYQSLLIMTKCRYWVGATPSLRGLISRVALMIPVQP